MRVKDEYTDTEFESLLDTVKSKNMSKWESEFIENIVDNYGTYKGDTYISYRQIEILNKILGS